MAGFCSGLHAVLHDVARRDQLNSLFPTIRPTKLERRKTFMLGLSFGGLVAFSYALQYPASHRYDSTDIDEIPIDGLIGVGPMVAYNEKFVVVSTYSNSSSKSCFTFSAWGDWKSSYRTKKSSIKIPKSTNRSSCKIHVRTKAPSASVIFSAS